ncbi:MAG: ribosomal protein [Candidatus Parcubacteria bacterium]|jgi:large subunit ribosomal protein L1
MAGKKYRAALEKVDVLKKYELAEAVALVKAVSYAKFGGSMELHVQTACNPKYNDQQIRGTVVLPHGTGKTVKVAVFIGEEGVAEAKAAGADIAGNKDLLKDIEDGKMDFDVLITTPDMMRDLAKVAKALGPKGLMPSPKTGTVTMNVTQAIDEVKKGRVEFKLDKTGNVHVGIGKISFADDKLAENVTAVLRALVENKPAGIKGKLFKKVVLAPTMGPGVGLSWGE